jgi:hypothetical protein
MVVIACLALCSLSWSIFPGRMESSEFQAGEAEGDVDGKMISGSDSDEEEGDGVQPPQYSESIDDTASITSTAMSTTAMRATSEKLGEVHVEMLPIMGFGMRTPAMSSRLHQHKEEILKVLL